ncbi:MAG: stage III sporulation protein AF [Clostridia bacterium]|nr:stage III sporulation protein AF [Clostridia bacterium]
MLEILGSLVRQVILIVLLAVFVEMLMPPGDLGRFVRLAMGLFVVAAMLGALSQLLPRIAPVAKDWRPTVPALEVTEIGRRARTLQQYQEEVALEGVRQQIAGQVAALLQGMGGLSVRHVVVRWERDHEPGTYPGLRQLEIEAEVAPRTSDPAGSSAREGQAALVAAAQERVARFYGLSPAQVLIRLSEQ